MPSPVATMVLLLTAVVTSAAACIVDHSLDVRPPNQQLPIARATPLDILFVVDNSPSMADEQTTLLRSVFDPACPIGDVSQVPQRFSEPSRDTFDVLSEVCGLSQLLAAVGGDFQLGVITTDVGRCDERLSVVQDPDDLHTPTAMRGCLQGPGIITRDDDVETAFTDALTGVGTFGSSFERGLDAMMVFLSEDSRRAEGCENDLDGFLRPEGRLLVVFVADEDDCSHQDGAFGFDNELAGEPEECGDFVDLFVNHTPRACIDHQDALLPIDNAKAFLDGLVRSGRTSDVLVSVIGGVVDNGDGLTPSACVQTDGLVTDQCLVSFGSGNVCDPEEGCCSADAGNRYVALARAVNQDSIVGSICADEFRAPLLPLFLRAELSGDDVFQ